MELKMLDWIQQMRTPVLDRMMCAVTKLGNAGALWIVLAVVLLLIPKKKKNRNHHGGSVNRRCHFM